MQTRIEELSNYIEQFLTSEQEQEEEPEEEFQDENKKKILLMKNRMQYMNLNNNTAQSLHS